MPTCTQPLRRMAIITAPTIEPMAPPSPPLNEPPPMTHRGDDVQLHAHGRRGVALADAGELHHAGHADQQAG